MTNDLAEFGKKLEKLVDGPTVRRIMDQAGQAGKKSALEAARGDLGGDRAMSNLRKGRAPLSAGYDDMGDTSVRINLRGPWRLADLGRRSSGTIYPRDRDGSGTLSTPWGPRRTVKYGPSRGLNTYDDAVRDAQRSVPKAAAKAFGAEIARVF